MSDEQRSLVVVAGPGRSGTSLVTTSLQRLGFHIPQPEIQANESNPTGFGEPRWAVDFHERLMHRANIFINDTRPAAWAAAAQVGRRKDVRRELTSWLEEQLDLAPRVAIKDPRITWFVDLYADVSSTLDAPVTVITMLRHPVEAIASRQLHYDTKVRPTGLLAMWLNQMLLMEQRTRDTSRAFVRYDELLTDWQAELGLSEEHSGLPLVSAASESQVADVDRLVDPSLRRAQATWDSLEAPGYMREIAEDAWAALCALAADGDQPHHLARLDDATERYRQVFKDARAVARSVVRAANRTHADELAAGRGLTEADPAQDADPGDGTEAPADPAPRAPGPARRLARAGRRAVRRGTR